MHTHALASMEYFDNTGGDAHVDFRTDEPVWDRVEEAVGLDVIIQIDAGAPPLRELPILVGQTLQRSIPPPRAA